MRSSSVLALVVLAGCPGVEGRGPAGAGGHPSGPTVTPGQPSDPGGGGEDTVTDPVPPSAVSTPVFGGGLLVLADGHTLAATDESGARLVLFDVEAGAQVGEVAFPEFSQPHRIVQDGAGLVWVSLRRAGQVVAVDPATAEEVGELAVCPAPRGMDVDADGSVWLACASGELVHFDASGVSSTWNLGPDLRDVVVDRVDGTLWVSRFRSAELLEVSRDGVVTATRTAPRVVNQNVRAEFEASVAYRTVADPAGGVVMVHQRASNGEQEEGPNAYGGDHCGAVVNGGVTRFGHGEPQTAGLLDQTPLPVDLTFGQDGSLVLAVAGARPGTSAQASVVRVPSAGWNPDDPTDGCITPAALAQADAHLITAVAYDGAGRLVSVAQQPFAILVDGVDLGSSGGRPEEVDAYRQFHLNAGEGVSCASCHPEGTDDGHVWRFVTLGERRTQSITGKISETAPFHWDGAFPTFDALAHDVLTRMGSTSVSGFDGGAMIGWIDGLEAPPVTSTASAEQIALGQAVFERQDTGCASCHSGSHLTDSQNHDVGTGAAFQAPSLNGVAARLPLMHDGCAVTLRDRFDDPTCGGGDEHGVTSGLTADEVDALVAYLESL